MMERLSKVRKEHKEMLHLHFHMVLVKEDGTLASESEIQEFYKEVAEKEENEDEVMDKKEEEKKKKEEEKRKKEKEEERLKEEGYFVAPKVKLHAVMTPLPQPFTDQPTFYIFFKRLRTEIYQLVVDGMVNTILSNQRKEEEKAMLL